LIAWTTTTPWSSDHDRLRTEPLLEARRHHHCSLLQSIRPTIEALLNRGRILAAANRSEAAEDAWVATAGKLPVFAARNPVARQGVWAESGVDLAGTEIGKCSKRPNPKPRQESS
jgi:beta-phosphoglucomutase-like phosphatase (HAD superfamily)